MTKLLLVILSLFMFMLTACTITPGVNDQSIDTGEKDLQNDLFNISSFYEEEQISMPFDFQSTYEIINLGSLGDTEIARVVGFYDTFGTDFKGTWSLESMFSCKAIGWLVDNNRTCTKEIINFPSIGLTFLVHNINGMSSTIEIIDGDIIINSKYIISRYVLQDEEDFDSQLGKTNFKLTTLGKPCIIENNITRFTSSGSYLYYGDNRYDQDPSLLYTNIIQGPYTDKVHSWDGRFGENFNTLIFEGNAKVKELGEYTKDISKIDNYCTNSNITNNALLFWSSITPDVYYKVIIKDGADTLTVDGLFSPSFGIDITDMYGEPSFVL